MMFTVYLCPIHGWKQILQSVFYDDTLGLISDMWDYRDMTN